MFFIRDVEIFPKNMSLSVSEIVVQRIDMKFDTLQKLGISEQFFRGVIQTVLNMWNGDCLRKSQFLIVLNIFAKILHNGCLTGP